MTTIALVFAATLALPASPTPPDRCTGQLDNGVLRTTIAFADGKRLVGPWRVSEHNAARRSMRSMHAVLDRIVEVDRDGERRVMRFPDRVAVRFEGRTDAELERHAARVWCATVMRARETWGERPSYEEPARLRVAMDTRSPADGTVDAQSHGGYAQSPGAVGAAARGFVRS